MRILLILICLTLSSCTTVVQQPSIRQGTPYRYSGFIGYTCVQCKKPNVFLYKLDLKDRVVCKECYQKSKKKYLYH